MLRHDMSNERLTSEESLAANGRSFHWARRFLGQRMGYDAARLYAFCRVLDDMADGDIAAGPARLQVIRADLLAGRSGADPAYAGFHDFMHQRAFPPDVIVALIDGLLDDQKPEVALANETELLRYAYCVAGTVGLLMCHVLDCHDEAARAHAIDLGIAMQLTNIARDVLEDAEMNRRYIPGDWVGGACPATIAEAAARPEGPVAQQVTIAVKRLLALAETFYASGRRGYGYLPIRAHLAIAVAARVYRQIGVQLADAGHAWHAGRQVTSSATKAGCSLRAMLTLTDRFAPRRGLHDPSLHSSLQGLPYVV